MGKKYETPVIEIIVFQKEDILMGSSGMDWSVDEWFEED